MSPATIHSMNRAFGNFTVFVSMVALAGLTVYAVFEPLFQ